MSAPAAQPHASLCSWHNLADRSTQGAPMGLIKYIAAPIRRLVRFPLFQLAVVVALILWLQAAAETSAFGHIFSGLDKLVDATVQLFSAIFNVRAFTKSWQIGRASCRERV